MNTLFTPHARLEFVRALADIYPHGFLRDGRGGFNIPDGNTVTTDGWPPQSGHKVVSVTDKGPGSRTQYSFRSKRATWKYGYSLDKDGNVSYLPNQSITRPVCETLAPTFFDVELFYEIKHALADSFLKVKGHFNPQVAVISTKKKEKDKEEHISGSGFSIIGDNEQLQFRSED